MGHDVVREAQAVHTFIGLAGQYPAVDENLTGCENLEMVGRLYHLTRQESRRCATELLESFGLTEASRRRAKTYSGGIRRRLDLAASLTAKPSVLLLDKPTAGLDPRSRLGLWEIIENLVEEGTTVFLNDVYLI
jgi:ABC-2 type transport system ATP-binding protein